jgi:2-polyprenyl-3-methyl-5-hydroxy-6-metoxy-1,4-benzoquinol methylase
MIQKLYSEIQKGNDVRKNLIQLKEELKKEKNKNALCGFLKAEKEPFFMLLENEDAKVRKNAAQILADLNESDVTERLWKAYQSERQMFVKSAYLTAMAKQDYRKYEKVLDQRLKELMGQPVKEENEKHVREEVKVLREMLLRLRKPAAHEFRPDQEEIDLILTGNKAWMETITSELEGSRWKVKGSLVYVRTRDLEKILKIRTYGEVLFPLRKAVKMDGREETIAETIAESGILKLCDRFHRGKGTFYFRLEVKNNMPLNKRGDFIQKISKRIEDRTEGRLINTPSNYELEIRLIENSEGRYAALVKFYTGMDKRFSYRTQSVAASMQPVQAAVIAKLAQPYLTEEGQILDPFCGVGTMLIERNFLLPAKVSYGIDLFGEAIKKARENTENAGMNIYYINRDYFQFQHDYLFDEIITDMPVQGKKTKEEQDKLYGEFFRKSKELLKNQGKIILYSSEKAFVKKHLRLNGEYRLLREFPLQEKISLYIIQKKEP